MKGFDMLLLYICLYLCSVNITDDGKSALVTLSGGDLRRVLNLLQSTHASYPEINADVVYMTAGAALPSVINDILNVKILHIF